MIILREDGKRPDGTSLISWAERKCLSWDVTVPDTYADSYLTSTLSASGSADSEAAIHKTAKYVSIANTHQFVPVAIETSGVFDNEAEEFLQQVRHRCTEMTEDSNETMYFSSYR